MREDRPESSNVTVVWQRLHDEASFEHLRLIQTDDGWSLRGKVIAAEEGFPLFVDYRVDCDAEWMTQSCIIEQEFKAHRRRVIISRCRDIWVVDGAPAEALTGCTDIDLGISPSTNTLPIRRLNLAAGQNADIHAAWVKFPALEIAAAEQRYERLGESRYAYLSLTSGFRAELETDGLGLVLDYGNIWKRIAKFA